MVHSALNLLACQTGIPETRSAEERDAHVERVATRVRDTLASEQADLVVLPELSSIEYSREAFNNLAVVAEDLDGPSFKTWSTVAQAHETTIVFGIARREGDGYRISQLAVGPNGHLIGHYDKIHIAQYGASMEKEYFERGGHLLTFEINGIKIAPIICYDIRIPELSRTLCVDHGVELVLHCGAYARDTSFHTWHQFVVTRALENQAYVMSLNRAGDGFGSSVFCPPWVDEENPVTAFGNEDGFRRFEVDSNRVAEARRIYPFLADRLSDYDTLPLK